MLQIGPVDGAIFADYGSDIGSGPAVPGKKLFTFLKLISIRNCCLHSLRT